MQLLRDNLENYDMGMYEQNVIAYLAKKQPQLISHMFFEDKFCLNCWYTHFHIHLLQRAVMTASRSAYRFVTTYKLIFGNLG